MTKMRKPVVTKSCTKDITFSRWILGWYDNRRHRRACVVCGGRITEGIMASSTTRKSVVVCCPCARALWLEMANN